MGKRSGRQLIFDLPLVLCATLLVTVCPVLLVWWLHDSGAVTSAWVGTGIGVAASFGVSSVGAALWKARTGSRDVLFGELMLWGWVQRWRAEQRLATASDVLGLNNGPRRNLSGGRLTHEQRAGLLTQLASALEARDPYTHGHSRRVARHASNIAKRMGLSAEEVAKIRTAGVVHDVGKVNTPTSVLHKEGKLTDGEYKVVKRHPVQGATMVSPLGDDELTAMVRHHHERLDGTGYPDGLTGDSIPLGARILAVADTFDAITSTRPYRTAKAHKRALTILTAEAGTQLDPGAVRAFCSHYSGSRPLVLWTILANGPPRLASWLGGGLGTAKASSVANVMATAATTAAVGGAAVGPLVEAPARSHRAPQAGTAPGGTAPGGTAPARQRPPPISVIGDKRARPLDARGQVKDEGLDGTLTALGGRRERPTRSGAGGTTPPSGAPAQDEGAPAQDEGRGEVGNTAPSGAPGRANVQDQGKSKDNGKVEGEGKAKVKVEAEVEDKDKGKGKGKGKDKDKDKDKGKDKDKDKGKDNTAPGRGHSKSRGRAHHKKRSRPDKTAPPRDRKTAPTDDKRPAGRTKDRVKQPAPDKVNGPRGKAKGAPTDGEGPAKKNGLPPVPFSPWA